MKIDLLLLALLLSFQLLAQSTINSDSTRFAEIKFEEAYHDFGILNKGDACVFEYKFTNIGNEPLIIKSAHTTCGCDQADWPTTPIMPGKSGVIRYRYDSNRIGGFHKSTTVISNAKTATIMLRVKGVVKDTNLPSEIKLRIEGD
jgi:hypothetical protein